MIFLLADRIPVIKSRIVGEAVSEKSSTDPTRSGILVLVNSSHEYANTNEKAVRLYDIKSSSFFLSTSEIFVDKRAAEPLCAMLDDFKEETRLRTINVISGKRSVASQAEIHDEKELKYGWLYASKYVQKPGFSEHHTGLAVDLALFNPEDGSSADFDGSGKYEWFSKNAWKYGFILRYPESKKSMTGISYEPWHFRYVGVPHAYYISKNGLCLEEYIQLLQKKSQDNPLRFTLFKKTYSVWHSSKKPRGVNFSGDNCGGYIAWK